jgi:hypothetical protein
MADIDAHYVRNGVAQACCSHAGEAQLRTKHEVYLLASSDLQHKAQVEPFDFRRKSVFSSYGVSNQYNNWPNNVTCSEC